MIALSRPGRVFVTRSDEQSATRLWDIRRQLREGTVDRLSAITALSTLQRSPNARVAALADETVSSVVGDLQPRRIRQ